MGQGTPWVDWAGTLHDLMFIFDTTAVLCHFPFTTRKKKIKLQLRGSPIGRTSKGRCFLLLKQESGREATR